MTREQAIDCAAVAKGLLGKMTDEQGIALRENLIRQPENITPEYIKQLLLWYAQQPTNSGFFVLGEFLAHVARPATQDAKAKQIASEVKAARERAAAAGVTQQDRVVAWLAEWSDDDLEEFREEFISQQKAEWVRERYRRTLNLRTNVHFGLWLMGKCGHAVPAATTV